MTIFAVMCAGIYPALHVGRIWFRLVAVPDSHLERPLAAIPLTVDVGRVRGLHLLHGLRALLVCRRP